ncbi:hypothetical protein [Paenibacillus aceti]|uniref:hypothetical protein n=1 Tax=Paenibacillus aceti TaxID=1820010 RepID=UPI0013C4685D|nr:hypothetical protein [Paenibacillus aceti]
MRQSLKSTALQSLPLLPTGGRREAERLAKAGHGEERACLQEVRPSSEHLLRR